MQLELQVVQVPTVTQWTPLFQAQDTSLYWPVEIQEALPALGLEVLDVLGFVQNQVPPGFPSERLVILQHQFVRGDADMEGIGFSPTLENKNTAITATTTTTLGSGEWINQ